MNFKRIVAIALCCSCLLSFASCKKKPGKNEETTAESTTEASTSLNLEITLPDSDVISSVLDESGLGELLEDYGVDVSGISGELGLVAGSVEDLVSLGFETDADLGAVLRPGEVSPEIEISKGDISALVSVANPYDKDIATRDGVIASCTVSDAAAALIGGFVCGQATPEQIMESLGQPYELSEDSLVYKVFGGKEWDLGNFGDLYTGFTADSLKNWELVFGLAGGVLTSVSLLDPALFHGGVEENVEPEELETITYEEQVQVVEIRNSILSELTDAFAKENIDAEVNSATGEIVLGDSVLFGNESYELSEEGKAYLDKVFGVYADVLLGGEYAGSVSAIVFEGHTNTLGTFEYNQDLSEKRAAAVLAHCLESEANGMSEDQRTQLETVARTKGCSYTDPVYTANGEVDMEASRRVCLKFHVTVEE